MSRPLKILLEVCVDSVESAMAAQEGGAARVELCDNLLEDGTTPSAGMIEMARQHLRIGLHVMIRPRGGDFCYSDVEFEVMKRDVLIAKRLGADGVVFGLLKSDHTVDLERARYLIQLARPLRVTFHRAFDLVADPLRALEEIINLGIERILTSGRAKTALDGLSLITRLVQAAAGRVIIMPGSGITPQNVRTILAASGAVEIHAGSAVSIKKEYPQSGLFLTPRHVIDPEKVRALLEAA
jgi:copper homeostasis protein